MSAIVLDSFNMLDAALGEKPYFEQDASRIAFDSLSILQKRTISGGVSFEFFFPCLFLWIGPVRTKIHYLKKYNAFTGFL